MNYLLDTCVISELIAKIPNQKVIQWIDNLDSEQVYLSIITIGEIQKGIEKLPNSKKKTILQTWLNTDLMSRFSGRIVGIDVATMLTWGQLTGSLEKTGKKMAAIDSLIAAITKQGNFTLVTRNEEDFKYAGITIANPWT